MMINKEETVCIIWLRGGIQCFISLSTGFMASIGSGIKILENFFAALTLVDLYSFSQPKRCCLSFDVKNLSVSPCPENVNKANSTHLVFT